MYNLSAQDSVQIFSLEEAKTYAMTHAWSLQQSDLEIEKAELRVKEALSALLPQANGQITYRHYGQNFTSIIPAGSFGPQQPVDLAVQFGVQENFDINFTATQMAFNGVFLVGMKAAKTFVEIEKRKKDISADEIKDQVTRAYYNALIAKENAIIISQNITKLEELLKTTQALYDNGVVEVIDVDRLKLSLSNLKTQVANINRQSDLAYYLLKFYMGYPIDDGIALSQSMEDFVANIQIPLIGDTLPFMQRKDYALMDLREDVNNANIKRFKAEYMPSLAVYGSMGALGLDQKFNFFGKENWYPYRFAGLQLNIPIWNSFGTKARVQTAQVDLERIQLSRQQLEAAITLEYQKAKTDYINANDELNNAKTNMELAEKIYRIAQIKYKEGVGSSLELTNAEQQLYTTQATLLAAKYKVLIAKTDMDKALGNY